MKKHFALLSLLLAACAVEEADPEVTTQQLANDDDPEDIPEEFPDQPPTISFSLLSKTATQVAMRFSTSADATSTKVERRLTGGTWAVVRSYGATTGMVSYTNTGLMQDTRYCYRIVSTNPGGTTTSLEKCALTEHPDNRYITRMQVELDVADVSGAGTNNRVGVSLNDTYWGNFTGLNYSHDDFERDSEFIYDVLFTNIDELHDISTIRITKWGTDSLCLRSLRLVLDGETAFTRNFGNTATTCQMLNGTPGQSNVLTISHPELRAATSFANWDSGAIPVFIPREEIEDRIEGIVGDLVWNNPDVYWGELDGPGVEITKNPVGTQRLDIDLDLAGSVPILDDPAVDVDIVLEVRFEGPVLVFETIDMDVHVEPSLWQQVVLGLGDSICELAAGEDCLTLIEGYIEDQVTGGFDGLSRAIPLDPGSCDEPTVQVTFDGALLFGCAQP